MKLIFTFIFTISVFISSSQTSIKCLRNDLYKEILEGKLINKKGKISACYNDRYFSFYTEETGMITFEIERHTRHKYILDGKTRDSFLNTESKTTLRGFYSVDISHGSEIEIVINYPTVPKGYAIIFSNKAWVGGQDASMHINENISSINKAEADTIKSVKKTEQIVIKKEPEEQVEIFTIVENAPEYPGGYVELSKFVKSNLKYPEIAKQNGISGKCFLKFVVNSTGGISNIEVLKGVSGCKECDEEAIRLVKSMPLWIPAKMSGKAVKAYYNLPISFKPN